MPVFAPAQRRPLGVPVLSWQEEAMEITTSTAVAEVATHHPASIRVFQRHAIDFCCGGKRALGEVCAEKGLAFEAVCSELAQAMEQAAPPVGDWRNESLTGLCAHIVSRYHFTLRAELPRLRAMVDKVLRVHGENHAELAGLAEAYRTVQEDLGPHMMKEERILFPYIQEMEGADAAGEALARSPFGTVQNPVAAMAAEHESVGQALAEMRRLSGGFNPPPDACNTFRGLYHGLVELERELHEHIHLENNVLFPRAVALEQKLQMATAARQSGRSQ
jgi:regulator of cell morphogenesis and NO signaling